MTLLPLEGRRILVTRRPEQSGKLTRKLRELGASVVEVPLLAIAPPTDAAPLDAALRALDRYHWIVFTSANAVRSVLQRLRTLAVEPHLPRVASVGPATSDAVREALAGLAIALEPAEDYRAEGLLAAFSDEDLRGRRILLPVSDRARDVLADGLRSRGAEVDRVIAYRTLPPADAGPALERTLAEGVDVVTFASPSAVENFVGLLPGRGGGTRAAVIGPVTEAKARTLGLDVVATAQPATAEGLAAALAEAFRR